MCPVLKHVKQRQKQFPASGSKSVREEKKHNNEMKDVNFLCNRPRLAPTALSSALNQYRLGMTREQKREPHEAPNDLFDV